MSRAEIEIAIVGAGPAGLSAALYAARYLRRTLVLHDDTPRAARIPCTRNVPGFERGITGPRLVARMTRHAKRYGARLTQARIERIERQPGGSFALVADHGRSWKARSVILATGIEHNHIPMDADCHEEASRRGVLRYCPVCDGYEHRGQRIAVVGCDTSGAKESLFLREFTDDLTLLTHQQAELAGDERRQLEAVGVRIVTEPVAGYALDGRGMRVRVEGRADPLEFDVVYPALGSRPRSALAKSLGIAVKEGGEVTADAPAGTSVPGVYCAGDVVEGLDQISVAMGQGALAATRAHNWLLKGDAHLFCAAGKASRKHWQKR
ncbi:MAG TPA: NAD(P)/FAD-dependent oxidoreductase [Steroidobacteraceae bacterium]|nr:NAD(P)/FAD-dependent oxidoreductase [Steroidobacteraceae bacterium]